MPDLRLEGASKFYKVEKQKLVAVQDINLTVEQGEVVFLTGSSGAGKTTELRMLGG
ncbi:MAG: ATP-binding cassette domain-containing protein, partial [Firmicutes bacterium]|nr:ATP-binding cassette domain-containing protein [Bacillota bacterium]